ncbi:MAG: putative membrane protein [Algoriphagus sp.]|jgi:putative membrane protein
MKNELENELIIRDYLARQRTTLANQRTLLSYIRTTLYFLISGIALFEVEKLDHVRDLGYLAFGFSFAFLIIGVINFYMIKSKLRKGNYMKM